MTGIVGSAGWTIDPPAMLSEDRIRRKAGHKLGTGDGAAIRSPDTHPVALLDAARRCGLPRHLDHRVGSEATQGCNIAVLAVAVSDGLCTAQAQRESLGAGRDFARRKCRHRGIAVLAQALGIDLDPTCRRRKPLWRSIITKCCIGLERDCALRKLNPLRRGAKIGHREAGRRQDGIVTAIRPATKKRYPPGPGASRARERYRYRSGLTRPAR